MKFTVTTVIIALSISSASFAADVEVSNCLGNPKAIYVSIKGQSAINIFRAFAARLKIKPLKMRNTISNGMNCEGTRFTNDGDVIEAECSYLMIGQKNIPYPQVDPEFSGEENIICN